MNPELHKFPRTPHLYWLGRTPARDDKVLPPPEAAAFLDAELVVEEKVDGANLGVSLTATSVLQFQNRGNFLEGKLTGQFAALRGWAARYRAALGEHLQPGVILFGEWCRVKHSIPYTALPDWFLGFDLLEPANGRFWNTTQRDSLLKTLGLPPVRRVARGYFSRTELLGLLGERSAYADAPLEGLYLRQEDGTGLIRRAKLVRAEFTQAIETHWAKGPLLENRLRQDLLNGS